MAIDHEMHKIRIKAVSDKMNHPMTYNDAGAPREDFVKRKDMKDMRGMKEDRRAPATEEQALLR